MADDRRLAELPLDDERLKISDDAVEDARLQIFARRVTAEAFDLDDIDAVRTGEVGRDAVPYRTRRTEAGDQDDRATPPRRNYRDMRQLRMPILLW